MNPLEDSNPSALSSFDQDAQAIKMILPEKSNSLVVPKDTKPSSEKYYYCFCASDLMKFLVIMKSLLMGLGLNAYIHYYDEEILGHYEMIKGLVVLKIKEQPYPTDFLYISEAIILQVLGIKKKSKGSYSNVSAKNLVVCLRNLQISACYLWAYTVLQGLGAHVKSNVDLRNEIYNYLIEEFVLIIGYIGTQEVKAKYQNGVGNLISYLAEKFNIAIKNYRLTIPSIEMCKEVIDKNIDSNHLYTFSTMSKDDYNEACNIRLMVDNEVKSIKPNHIAVYDFFEECELSHVFRLHIYLQGLAAETDSKEDF